MDALQAAETVVMSDPPKRKGPRPGSRHSGMFTSDDPRRWTQGPRNPKVRKEFAEKAKELTDAALKVLSDCMLDNKAPWRERRAAAELALSHGHGAPVSRILMAQAQGSGTALEDRSIDDLVADMRLIHSRQMDEEESLEAEFATEGLPEPEQTP
jgi:hypothetical protein